MKHKYLKTLLPIFLMTAFVHADQGASTEEKKEPNFIQYHNRMIVFFPLHQGYERIKPDAFYVGLEGYLASVLNKGNDNLLDKATLFL